MRIKYLYQLVLSNVSIIIVAFLGLGLLFANYVENMVYQNKIDDLTAYGENILYDVSNSRESGNTVLRQYYRVLSNRNIQFFIFDKNRQIIYPVGGRITIEDDEWNKIENGQTVIKKHETRRFDETMTFVLLPYFQNGTFIGGILLTTPVSGISSLISQVNNYLFYTALVVLFMTFILSWFLSSFHVKRIKRIQEATSRIAEGDYSVRLKTSNFDEIGELAEDFNVMVDQLEKSMDEIDSLEKRRRQFMADVSHEMRTPLTTISGVIEGIRNDMIPEEEKEKGINLVSKETKRLIRLVNENLDYEKIRSNQVKLMKEEIQLFEMLDIIKEQLEFLAEEKNNKIILDVKEDVYVLADYDRLTQILMNIIKNSIQFTDDGVIVLRGKAGYKETVIEIEDNGIGIDPNEIENIWRRFYKADLSRTTVPYGEFGLGLSIVQKLVALHQGTVEVVSEEGKGTKFTIRLPYKQDEE